MSLKNLYILMQKKMYYIVLFLKVVELSSLVFQYKTGWEVIQIFDTFVARKLAYIKHCFQLFFYGGFYGWNFIKLKNTSFPTYFSNSVITFKLIIINMDCLNIFILLPLLSIVISKKNKSEKIEMVFTL